MINATIVLVSIFPSVLGLVAVSSFNVLAASALGAPEPAGGDVFFRERMRASPTSLRLNLGRCVLCVEREV